ncbi:MAG TPA: hypothetical protein VGX23_17475 [Actinocrinis sp.]|nr:hypothetical protein [Actinocrinis sp.]
MDRDQAVALRELLSATSAVPEWVAASAEFGWAVQGAPQSAGGLLVAGPAQAEPWHFTAHLTDEARWAGLPQLAPTLVRSDPAADAPAHLAVGWERLARAGRGEALLVVAEFDPQEELLERIDGARRQGARVLALARSAPELRGIAHETLVVPAPVRAEEPGPLTFDTAQHLLSLAVTAAQRGRRAGLRSRLTRWQERVNGPTVESW